MTVARIQIVLHISSQDNNDNDEQKNPGNRGPGFFAFCYHPATCVIMSPDMTTNGKPDNMIEDMAPTLDDTALRIKQEKRILKISMAGTITFVLAEVICAILTRSMALLMDCVYDGTDLIMAVPFLILVPHLYKPVTEHRPYGVSQIESFLLLIKYSALLCLTIALVKESAETIATGGNPVEAKAIAIFEVCVSAGCMVMMLMIRRLARDNMTPTLKAELFLWKLSALSTLGVGVAFIINIALKHTSLAWIYPYVDPAVAIICAIFLAKEPILMIIESIRNLILFAPPKDITEKIEEIAREKCQKYGVEATFCEVVKTGRRLWINVYYYPRAKSDSLNSPDNLSIDLKKLNELDAELEKALEEEFDDVWLEMIMDLLEYRDVKKMKEAARRDITMDLSKRHTKEK